MGLFNGFSFISPVEFCYWTLILVQGLFLKHGRIGKVLYNSFLAVLVACTLGAILAVVFSEHSM